MKRALLLLAIISIVAQATAQKANTFVTGKLEGLSKDKWIYLMGFGGNFRDSTQQTDKGFKFDLHIPEGEGDFYIF